MESNNVIPKDYGKECDDFRRKYMVSYTPKVVSRSEPSRNPQVQKIKTFTGPKKQRKAAQKKASYSKHRKTLCALLASGFILLGGFTTKDIFDKMQPETYLPTTPTVMEQVEYAIQNPKYTQLDDLFTRTSPQDLEEMKIFETNILNYSKLMARKELTFAEREELKNYQDQIQKYYNQNTSSINSTMLGFVKASIADSYNSSHPVDYSSQYGDMMFARNIRFSNVLDGNYLASYDHIINQVGPGDIMNFKDSPEIIDAVRSIVFLQNGNTDVAHIVEAYAKCSKTLDLSLSIEKEKTSTKTSYTISTQRKLERNEEER